ncbi:unnamed protein product [Arctogadus glacialis]
MHGEHLAHHSVVSQGCCSPVGWPGEVQGSLGMSADRPGLNRVETEVFQGILVLYLVTDEQIPDLTADKTGCSNMAGVERLNPSAVYTAVSKRINIASVFEEERRGLGGDGAVWTTLGRRGMGVGGGPVCVLSPVLGAVAGIGRGDMGSFSPYWGRLLHRPGGALLVGWVT